jgi:hypothetical protein
VRADCCLREELLEPKCLSNQESVCVTGFLDLKPDKISAKNNVSMYKKLGNPLGFLCMFSLPRAPVVTLSAPDKSVFCPSHHYLMFVSSITPYPIHSFTRSTFCSCHPCFEPPAFVPLLPRLFFPVSYTLLLLCLSSSALLVPES